MSEVGGHGSFLWENQTWDLSISDKSLSCEEKFEDKKLPGNSGSGSISSQTEIGKDQPRMTKKRSQGTGHDQMNKTNDTGSVGGEVKEGKGGESDHETHIWTERERRKKMRTMFSNLHALLPQLPPKADKSTIVDEAVNYIKTLQNTLQKLQKQKLGRLQAGAMTTFGYDQPCLNIIPPQKHADQSREAFLADHLGSSSCNNLAITTKKSSAMHDQISRSYPVLFQTWTSSNVVLNICGDEAQISICSPKKPRLFTTICYVLEKHNVEVRSVHVSSDCNRSMYMIQAHASTGASDQLGETFLVEEIYKQVACEIMCWISSCDC